MRTATAVTGLVKIVMRAMEMFLLVQLFSAAAAHPERFS